MEWEIISFTKLVYWEVLAWICESAWDYSARWEMKGNEGGLGG